MSEFAFLSPGDVRRHPRFRDAFDGLIDGLAALYGDDVFLVRRLVEYERAIAFMLAIALDASHDPQQPETWPTVARLRQMLATMQIFSTRRIDDLVSSMCEDGLFTVERATTDRRVRLLKPSERALELDRAWLATFHAPLAMLAPSRATDLALAHDPAYQRAYRVAGIQTTPIASRIVNANDTADYFIKATAGTRIFALLLQSIRGRQDHRTDPGFYSQAAAPSAVSRVHIRNVLNGAADIGLVVLSSPPGQYVQATPKLIEEAERFVAESLSATDLVATYAIRSMRTD